MKGLKPKKIALSFSPRASAKQTADRKARGNSFEFFNNLLQCPFDGKKERPNGCKIAGHFYIMVIEDVSNVESDLHG